MGYQHFKHLSIRPVLIGRFLKLQQSVYTLVCLHAKKQNKNKTRRQQVSKPRSTNWGLCYSTKNSHVDFPALALKPGKGDGFQCLSSSPSQNVYTFLVLDHQFFSFSQTMFSARLEPKSLDPSSGTRCHGCFVFFPSLFPCKHITTQLTVVVLYQCQKWQKKICNVSLVQAMLKLQQDCPQISLDLIQNPYIFLLMCVLLMAIALYVLKEVEQGKNETLRIVYADCSFICHIHIFVEIMLYLWSVLSESSTPLKFSKAVIDVLCYQYVTGHKSYLTTVIYSQLTITKLMCLFSVMNHDADKYR